MSEKISLDSSVFTYKLPAQHYLIKLQISSINPG